jgi:hypothetical protein
MTTRIEELRKERKELLAKQTRYLKANGAGFDPYAFKIDRLERELLRALGVHGLPRADAPAKGEAEWNI